MKRLIPILCLKFFFSACNITNDNDALTQQGSSVEDDSLNFQKTGLSSSSLTMEIADDTIKCWFNEELLVKSYLQPLTMAGGSPDNPQELRDEAFIMANNLIILRNIITAGHFCHTPFIKQVEIYTVSKDTIIIKDPESEDFTGNRFSSPDDTWGLITDEAEGMLTGFMIIMAEGLIIKKTIRTGEGEPCGETFNARFTADNYLEWPALRLGNDTVALRVARNGDYQIVKK